MLHLIIILLVPGKPFNVVLQIFGRSAKLTWNPPMYPNGFIEEYTVIWYVCF